MRKPETASAAARPASLPAGARPASLPAGGLINAPTELVCLALALAVVVLAARIASFW
jgi:hypothetical protein